IMYLDKKDAAGMRRLLALEELSGSWRETIGSRLAALEAAQD
ncbi:MOSC domain-containing protein, partial [Paenibacillus sepulcri]|nr:MOSC domain-containing protein [Paenibacillus sepulcri]